MCLPGTCFSLFQGNRENKAAHTSTPLPRASPESRHQALNNTKVLSVTVKQPCRQ